ncbi:MAG: phosphopyruvate hydratase [Candidatus Methanoliparum thermophilum]|uniref:Enolase n=1 Tax=Methanoliparum thermophilum TaxID=2491083 RepID=A0A520KQT3_METT2|nr:phosphopyruvate hydratase [Candidatus Methanoliparum sp. LAM-1]RZN63876.1 MAG: phosphopyruvate hydratase [Candidatus Methanoliparum thermophilum]BDC36394.1 phosphopyruvate hydratase [Candidatus Methanoliparum sp. LAM-1]
MFEIKEIKAREILDSRGQPTVEVDVITDLGFGRASVPSGASTGTNEALELRDKDRRYMGKGVKKAVDNINRIIRPKLIGYDVRDQRLIDETMIRLDGTNNKSNLGANAILGISLSVAKAAADSLNIPLYKYLGGANSRILPYPLMNFINGGLHAGNDLSIQEFMIIPIEKKFSDILQIASEVYTTLKNILIKKYGKTAINVGDEGGFAPPIGDTREALNLMERAVDESGYTKKIFFALDAAATEFYLKDKGYYEIDGKKLDNMELLDYYKDLIKEYNIVSIEDPFMEEDFSSFAKMTNETDIQIVGDDLFVTNTERLKTGFNIGAANALLLKLNQIGTVSEALDAANMAFRSKYNVIVSHRSGETEDTYIADLAVALNCGQIKTGSPARGERVAKYNRILIIEEELGDVAVVGSNLEKFLG